MATLEVGSIPLSLGEIINYKYHLDLVKNRYSEINLSFNFDLLKSGLHTNRPDWNYKESLWRKYINDIGQLFFSEYPYNINPNSRVFRGDLNGLLKLINMAPQLSRLPQYMCKGLALNVKDYIVLTTKVRESQKFDLMEMFDIIKNKKIVVLGERVVEQRKEYSGLSVYGIYDDIITNIPKENLIDLTVPALGETVSDLKQIQQDCYIMHMAKFNISIGIGGNLGLAIASGKVIGYRTDNNPLANQMYARETDDIKITKSYPRFLQALRENL